MPNKLERARKEFTPLNIGKTEIMDTENKPDRGRRKRQKVEEKGRRKRDYSKQSGVTRYQPRRRCSNMLNSGAA